ncbi:alpha/beta hydrolase fold domain-containing protein [Amnibacterium sp. CER49]|uniref:alpha/beta hydrolase n=1 Tax=Amnibacterium sp. CER49 TaxID=3039161 RepID=UPI00244C7982|nr:alpha/beta hydrolase fold domain-containing protein [Amnibacterium sp. CER49]MDH2444875.1 alpha/beta hydrolase fold domain-containing protein [Amnibacterium sp. CER49]
MSTVAPATEEVVLEAAGHPFRVRLHRPDAPTGAALVWAHGGGFLGGSLDMPEADETARLLADRGVAVVSVGYSLAPADLLLALPDEERGPNVPSRARIEAEIAASGPRVRYPVASLQLLAALDWTIEHATDLGATGTRVAIGGASAGGNLAASAALRARDRGTVVPAALLLCYPVLHAELPAPSPDLARALALPDGSAPPEPPRVLELNYVGDPALLAEPYAFPGGHDVSGLPPTTVVNAGRDRLRASAEAFAAELAVAGVDVAVSQERDADHGYLNHPGHQAALRTVARFVRALTEEG